jgi:hypothetical protein
LPRWIPLELAFLALLFAGFAISSIRWQQGGVIHPESGIRLPHYLDPGTSALSKLFHVGMTEYGCHDAERKRIGCTQNREASYLFDWIDSRFVRYGFDRGVPHFVSLTHYLFLLVLCGVAWHHSRYALALPAIPTLLSIALFLLSPGVFFAGGYFRTAKIGAALGLFALLVVAGRNEAGSPEEGTGRRNLAKRFAALFLLALVTCLFDKQGVFLVALLAGLSLLVFLLGGRRRGALTAVAAGGAVAIHFGWSHLLSAALTRALHGYDPDFGFARLDLRAAFAPASLAAASGYSIDVVRFLLGGSPPLVAGIALLGLAFLIERELEAADVGRGGALVLVVLVPVAVVAMTALMGARHPAIFWPDARRGYYPLPVLAALLFLMGVALRRIRLLHPRLLPAATLLIAAACAGNLAALPVHSEIIRSGHLQSTMEDSRYWLGVLRRAWDPASGHYRLTAAERRGLESHRTTACLLALNEGRALLPPPDPAACCMPGDDPEASAVIFRRSNSPPR